MGFFDFVGDVVKGIGDVAGDIVGGVLDIGGDVVGGVLGVVGLDGVGKAIDGALDDVGGFLDDAISLGGKFAAFGLDPINNLQGMLGAAGDGAAAGQPGEVFRYDRAITEEVTAGLAQLERGLHDSVLEPLRGMQGRLGDIWIGSDADQLAEAMGQQIPQLQSILGSLGSLQNSLRSYTQSIDEADSSVAAKMAEMAEEFAQVA
jgi:uncharacterized protein YukE